MRPSIHPSDKVPIQTIDPLLVRLGNEVADLRVLRDGYTSRLARQGMNDCSFRGRPQLISELVPVFALLWAGSRKQTITTNVSSLRKWWRIFDLCENETSPSSELLAATDFTEFHWRKAIEMKLARTDFYVIKNAIEIIREAHKLRKLFLQVPRETQDPENVLPPESALLRLRHELRKNWYAVLDRWELADAILSGAAISPEHENLAANYVKFVQVMAQTGQANPHSDDLCENADRFLAAGFRIKTMRSGFYPDEESIRAIFTQCLAVTGWNTSTLLSLRLSDPFLSDHPADPDRSLLVGYKPRSGTHQYSVGLWKSQSSAGFILRKLIERTEPLRDQLRSEQLQANAGAHAANAIGDTRTQLMLESQSTDLSRLIDSPWLYVSTRGSSSSDRIMALHSSSHFGSYFNRIIEELNAKHPDQPAIPTMELSDLRDAFAAFVWKATRGSILHMMTSLGHKHLRSTATYANNTIINQKSKKLFHEFINLTWANIAEQKTVDPTLLAAQSQHGDVSPSSIMRLKEYRELVKSRMGVGCKDPYSPSKSVEPDFKADGRYPCGAQRCLLCPANAVLLADSDDGIAMRAEELIFLQSRVSMQAWVSSQYSDELENVESALSLFEPQRVKKFRDLWRSKIESGSHRVPGL